MSDGQPVTLKALGVRRRGRLYPVRLGAAHTRWAVREIAALNFLSHVPMAEEAALLAMLAATEESKALEEGQDGSEDVDAAPAEGNAFSGANGDDDDESYVGQAGEALFRDDDSTAKLLMAGAVRLPFRRLQGPSCGTGGVPPDIRFSLRLLPGSAEGVVPAEVRRWEAGLAPRLRPCRQFFSARRAYPVLISSVALYRPGDDARERVRARVQDEQGEEVLEMPSRDWRGFSYHWLLQGRWREEWRRQAHVLQLKWLPQKPFRELQDPFFTEIRTERFRKHARGQTDPAATLGFGLENDKELLETIRDNLHQRDDEDEEEEEEEEEGDDAVASPKSAKAHLLDDEEEEDEEDEDEDDEEERRQVPEPPQAPLEDERDDDEELQDKDYRGYRPGTLDDPEMVQGRHRHVLVGDARTGPLISSVLLFVRPEELKAELNEQFRERHPQLPPSLTLSKIRSLKRCATLMAAKAGLDLSTIALSCCYFERLCYQRCVTKINRRVVFAACVLLAYKFNERRDFVPQTVAGEGEPDMPEEHRALEGTPGSEALDELDGGVPHRGLRRTLAAFLKRAFQPAEQLADDIDEESDTESRRESDASPLPSRRSNADSLLDHPQLDEELDLGHQERTLQDDGDGLAKPKPKLRSGGRHSMEWMWHLMDQRWGVSRKQVLAAEFGVFARLSFVLHEPLQHILYHWHRLLPILELDSRRYLGLKGYQSTQRELYMLLSLKVPDEPIGKHLEKNSYRAYLRAAKENALQQNEKETSKQRQKHRSNFSILTPLTLKRPRSRIFQDDADVDVPASSTQAQEGGDREQTLEPLAPAPKRFPRMGFLYRLRPAEDATSGTPGAPTEAVSQSPGMPEGEWVEEEQNRSEG